MRSLAAQVRLLRHGRPNAACPDYRTQSVTPAPLTEVWSVDWWLPRHEKKLADAQALRAAGQNADLVFIGDSITQGWEDAGRPVWERHFARHHALDLGFGGDRTEKRAQPDTAEPDADRAQEVYGHFVRRLITWLTLRTAAGELFDIDTALRPNGNSGLLVTSIDSFERYQRGRGSNTAWTWEHQALSRARFCAGTAALGSRFEAIRREVLAMPREPESLRAEVHAMREKVRSARPVPAGRYDVKHSDGGMMDAEFAVQFLVLAEGARHPELLDNKGNIALLVRAEEAGLLPAGVGHAAANAYRELRRVQHRARLDEAPTQVEPPALQAERDAVLALWQAVFGAGL